MESAVRREIGLTFSREQSSLVVEALAERPFKEVFGLIGQLHAHAGGRIALEPAQLRLILAALGAMPFARVCVLLQGMRQQMLAPQD